MKRILIALLLIVSSIGAFEANVFEETEHNAPEIFSIGLQWWPQPSDSLLRKDTLFTQFTIVGGTFDLDVEIIVSQDIERSCNYVNSALMLLPEEGYTIEDFDARALTLYRENGYPIIIWLPGMSLSAEDVSIANHELFHATYRILDWAGVPLTPETDEVFAYELQRLSKQFYKHFE